MRADDPLTNSLHIPAGILQDPYFSASNDPALNFAGSGVIIGHENSHGSVPCWSLRIQRHLKSPSFCCDSLVRSWFVCLPLVGVYRQV